jgi:hypothetical protein
MEPYRGYFRGSLQGIYRKAEEADERYKAVCPEFPSTPTKTERD